MKRSFILLPAWIFASVLLFSCEKESAPQLLFKGPEAVVGNGVAYSWVRVNTAGIPEEIGVELSAAALTGLPANVAQVTLPLPEKAKAVTPFNHIGLDYQPAGHMPAGIFDVEHFDIHFYLITHEERMAIPAVSPATLPLFDMAPPAAYMPAGYVPGGPEGQMGKHWLMPPPTFLPFTRVMIYGTYNGEVKFIEPMVTVAHLKTIGSKQPYTQPQKFAKAGNYPSTYNVYQAGGNYNVTLTDFVARPAN